MSGQAGVEHFVPEYGGAGRTILLYIMISGISAATSGLAAAQARMERAAERITSGFDAGDTLASAQAPDVLDIAGAEIEMMTAKFAFSASLVALRTSTDMLAEAITIGGYGVDPREMA